jgi:hypothetical protein
VAALQFDGRKLSGAKGQGGSAASRGRRPWVSLLPSRPSCRTPVMGFLPFVEFVLTARRAFLVPYSQWGFGWGLAGLPPPLPQGTHACSNHTVWRYGSNCPAS